MKKSQIQKNPKILHRIYFPNFRPFHDPFLHYLDSWYREMPDYKVMLWGPDNLDVNENEWTRTAFANSSPVFLSEYFRWKVLKQYGGMYLDADCEILNGPVLHNVIEELYAQNDYDCFFGVEEFSNGHPTAQTFGAKLGSDFVDFMIDLYTNRLTPLWHWRETRGLIGPQLMSLYFRNRGINTKDDGFFKNLHAPVIEARVKVYPQSYFSPKFSLTGDLIDFVSTETCVYHMFANSNVDFSKNRKMQQARDKALTFKEYCDEVVAQSQFPRTYDFSHFSVGEGKEGARGISGRGNGLLVYGPYVALPEGRYVARFYCPTLPKSGRIKLRITAGSGARVLGEHTYALSRDRPAALDVDFSIGEGGAQGIEFLLEMGEVDHLLFERVEVKQADASGATEAAPVKAKPAVPQTPNLKRIHRIYFGFDGKPDPFGRYLESWQRQLPDFEICHWNASNLPMDINAYVRQLYVEKDHAFLTDYFRWYLLRELGGSYFDADLEVVNGSRYRNLIEELEQSRDYDAFIGIDERSGGWYTAHSMASKPGSELAEYMCEVYENFGKFVTWRKKGMYFWAPQLVGLYFAEKGYHCDGMGTMPRLDSADVIERVKVYPQEWFSPLAPTGNPENPFELSGYGPQTTLCHHFACSWHDADSIYLSYSREQGGQAKMLLNEVVVARGGSILTEEYFPTAHHFAFSPHGRHLQTEVGRSDLHGIKAAGQAGLLVYGIDQRLSPGRYKVKFLVAAVSAHGHASIQVVAEGGSRMIGSLDVQIQRLEGPGSIYCEFELEDELFGVDCRLFVDQVCRFVVREVTIDRVL